MSSNSPAADCNCCPYDPDFEKTVGIANEVMDEYRDMLAVLAK